VSGCNETSLYGNYGEQGTPNESNLIPAKFGALGWIDLNGNFWIFGGTDGGNTKEYSDMNFV
jgi:hypothetical protein